MHGDYSFIISAAFFSVLSELKPNGIREGTNHKKRESRSLSENRREKRRERERENDDCPSDILYVRRSCERLRGEAGREEGMFIRGVLCCIVPFLR